MAIDMFQTRTMLDMVKGAEFAPTSFLRDRYFGNVKTFDTNKVDVDIVDRAGRKLAPFVNPKIGGQVIERSGYRTHTYEAPEVSPYMVTTAEDLLKRLPGEALYSSVTPEQRAAEKLGEDLRELDEIITRREEAMCAEALFAGHVSVKGKGYDEVVSFWDADESAKPMTEVTTKWNAAGADILADLRSIRRAVIQQSGITPTEVICSADVIDAILANEKVAEQLNTRRAELGQIKIDQLPNGVTYYGNLGGLDIYGYDSWYVDGEEEKPFVPAGLALMGSPAVKTTMAYGCCGVYGEGLALYAEKRVPSSWTQEMNPAGRIVQVKSRPLPIVHQVGGFHVIKAI